MTVTAGSSIRAMNCTPAGLLGGRPEPVPAYTTAQQVERLRTGRIVRLDREFVLSRRGRTDLQSAGATHHRCGQPRPVSPIGHEPADEPPDQLPA